MVLTTSRVILKQLDYWFSIAMRGHGSLEITLRPGARDNRALKDVRANCYCASLLRTKFICHVMHRARALSSKMNNDRAGAHCYSFDWL